LSEGLHIQSMFSGDESNTATERKSVSAFSRRHTNHPEMEKVARRADCRWRWTTERTSMREIGVSRASEGPERAIRKAFCLRIEQNFRSVSSGYGLGRDHTGGRKCHSDR